MDNFSQIIQVLYGFMDDNNVSQRKLARNTGIDVSIICKLLSGKKLFTVKYINKFSEYFHVCAGVFVCHEACENCDTKGVKVIDIQHIYKNLDELCGDTYTPNVLYELLYRYIDSELGADEFDRVSLSNITGCKSDLKMTLPISEKNIRRWRNGEHRVPLILIYAFADVLCEKTAGDDNEDFDSAYNTNIKLLLFGEDCKC